MLPDVVRPYVAPTYVVVWSGTLEAETRDLGVNRKRRQYPAAHFVLHTAQDHGTRVRRRVYQIRGD